jgi:histidyl-tRNA synthetase
MSEKIQAARGTRDFLPIDVRKREYVVKILKEIYESYGFEPLETPAIENLETLLGKYGEEGNKLMFKILKRGEKLQEALNSDKVTENNLADLALRYDLTVPLARVVANHRDKLPRFFKRYQIQPVWRADRPAKGRFREFYQCDLDVIGSNSSLVEAEIFSIISNVLRRLGFKNFKIRLNHREILRELFHHSGITDEKQQLEAIIAIDKFDKIGRSGVIQELSEKQIPHDMAEKLLNFLYECSNIGDNQTILQNLVKFFGNRKTEAIKNIEQILNLSENVNLKLDLTLARGLDYYTGAIMEVTIEGLNISVGGGGRYDNLIGMFMKEPIPACGFSFGLERILVLMEEARLFPESISGTPIDALVTIWNEELALASLRLADELRTQGAKVIVYPQADKISKQLKYASQIGVRFVCILGENEVASDMVTIKNLSTGDQETVNKQSLKVKILGS